MVDAVKKHVRERVEDLQKEMDDAGDAQQSELKRQTLLKMQAASVGLDSTWNDFGFDEFDRVEVLLEVEEAFGGFIIPDEEADKMTGIKQAVDFLKQQALAAPAPAE